MYLWFKCAKIENERSKSRVALNEIFANGNKMESVSS